MESVSFEGSLDSAPPSKGLYSTGYFPALLTAIRAANLNVPVDTAILQSILLCLVAPGMSNRNLILTVKEEDLNLVQNLAAVVRRVYLYSKFCEPLTCFHLIPSGVDPL
jgi:hypothetical protein